MDIIIHKEYGTVYWLENDELMHVPMMDSDTVPINLSKGTAIDMNLLDDEMREELMKVKNALIEESETYKLIGMREEE